jgi:hypothetical protein
MPHEHKLTKIKEGVSFDCDTGFLVLENTSPTTIEVAGVNLYPGNQAWYCGTDEKVEKAIKNNKLTIVENNDGKTKIKKVISVVNKEKLLEETSVTVAETEAKESVQLSSSEETIASLDKQ